MHNKFNVKPSSHRPLGYYSEFIVQYIPRNMHTVFALLCFVVVIHWLVFPYPSGLLHWHCGNLTIAPVPAKQPWWIWINTSREFIMNDCITTTKQSTTKPCAYFLGYTVFWIYCTRHCFSYKLDAKISCCAIGFNRVCIRLLGTYTKTPLVTRATFLHEFARITYLQRCIHLSPTLLFHPNCASRYP